MDVTTLQVRRRMRALWKEFAYNGLDGSLSGEGLLNISFNEKE
jgi:hypothetical protein